MLSLCLKHRVNKCMNGSALNLMEVISEWLSLNHHFKVESSGPWPWQWQSTTSCTPPRLNNKAGHGSFCLQTMPFLSSASLIALEITSTAANCMYFLAARISRLLIEWYRMHVNGDMSQKQITLQIEAYKPTRHRNSAAQSDIQLQSDKSNKWKRSLNKSLCLRFDFSTIQKARFPSCVFLRPKLLLLKSMHRVLEPQSHNAQGSKHLARQNMIQHDTNMHDHLKCAHDSLPRLLSNRNRTKHGKTTLACWCLLSKYIPVPTNSQKWSKMSKCIQTCGIGSSEYGSTYLPSRIASKHQNSDKFLEGIKPLKWLFWSILCPIRCLRPPILTNCPFCFAR